MGVVITPVAQTFGRYELLAYLGSGAMSDVFVAMHTGLRKRVALKILRPSLRHDRDAVERFQREGECAARVSHPNVVDVTDVGTHQGVPYLVMELLEGEPLDQKLQREGALPLSAAIDLILPILEGVAATHAAGVLHRDIKPANILLSRTPDGSLVPKLVDFGIATVEERRNITGALGPIGTPHYMSPEQARGARGLDEKSDQYSIASMLYECLTGREPFPGADINAVLTRVARGRFPRVRDVQPRIPAAFDDVLARATALNPERRFASVTEFANALLPFASARTRRLWISRDARNGVFSAQLLSGVWRLWEDDSGELEANQTTQVVRVSRPSQRLGLVAIAVAALSAGLLVGALHGGRVFSASKGSAVTVVLPRVAASDRGAPTITQKPLAAAARRSVQVEPSNAEIFIDGSFAGRGSFSPPHFTDGRLHELRVSAPGFVTRIALFRDELLSDKIALGRDASAP